MKCVERKIRLSGEELSFDCELLTSKEEYAVLKYVIEQSRTVGGILLPCGTVTLALYYTDRFYNLYYWIAPREDGTGGGSTGGVRARPAQKGQVEWEGRNEAPWARDIACYFNIAEPLRLSSQEVVYRDLVVDVLVLPDGTVKVLDESQLPDRLEAGLRHRIAATLDELLANHSQIINEARGILSPFAAAL